MKSFFIISAIIFNMFSQLHADTNLTRFDGIYFLKSAEGEFEVRQGEGSKIVPATDVCQSQITISGKLHKFYDYLKLAPARAITFKGIDISPIQSYGSRIYNLFDETKHQINNSSVSRIEYYTKMNLDRTSLLECSAPFSKYSSSKNKVKGERISWIDGKLVHKEQLSFEKVNDGSELIVKIFRKTQFNADLPPSSMGRAVCIYTKK